MAFGRSRRNQTVTETTKPTLMTRLRGRNAKTQTVKTTTTVHPNGHHGHHTNGHHTTAGTTTARRSRWGGRSNRTAVHHQHRHATFGDKISGAMLKLRGSLTGRPGLKVRSSHKSPFMCHMLMISHRQQELAACTGLMVEEVIVPIRCTTFGRRYLDGEWRRCKIG